MYINKTNTLCCTTTINGYIRDGRRRDQCTAKKTCENEKHAKPSRTRSCYLSPPPQDEIPLNKIHHRCHIYFHLLHNYYLLNCFGDNIYEHKYYILLYSSPESHNVLYKFSQQWTAKLQEKINVDNTIIIKKYIVNVLLLVISFM